MCKDFYKQRQVDVIEYNTWKSLIYVNRNIGIDLKHLVGQMKILIWVSIPLCQLTLLWR